MGDMILRRLFVLASVLAFLGCVFALFVMYMTIRDEESGLCITSDAVSIVIDAGHGGDDPGCVFESVMEADINLDIAMKLKAMLEEKGFIVIALREDESGVLAQGSENWEKSRDMTSRKEIITNCGAQMFISIHQNSYPDKSCNGAQVFYSGCRAENEKLALLMRQRLSEISPYENKRTELRNDSLFIIKDNPMPSVLIECGFLSNETDREYLLKDEYRQSLAHAIFDGVCIYFDIP